jgi:hypothetical protein
MPYLFILQYITGARGESEGKTLVVLFSYLYHTLEFFPGRTAQDNGDIPPGAEVLRRCGLTSPWIF